MNSGEVFGPNQSKVVKLRAIGVYLAVRHTKSRLEDEDICKQDLKAIWLFGIGYDCHPFPSSYYSIPLLSMKGSTKLKMN